MEVSIPVIVLLVVVILFLGVLFAKFKSSRYTPFIGFSIAVFFLVYGLVNREYFYPSLFCFLLAGYTGIRSLLSQRGN
jgi:hypothetical protein